MTEASLCNPVNTMIEVRNLVKISEACPTQWEADTNDRRIRIRYRWGNLEVYDFLANGDRSNPPTYEMQHGDCYDGFLETADMKQLLSPHYNFCDESC